MSEEQSYNYEIKAILSHKYLDGDLYYKIQFKGYWKNNAKWCHFGLINALDLLSEYYKKCPLTHGGGLKLHLQLGQFVGLNQTAGEVSTP